MNVLTVVAHPRTTSLTFAAAERFAQGLADAGHETEVLDLHRVGFDPVLREADEPDWSNPNKTYSPETEAEIERMKRHDALAYIFPMWWYDVPAILKGYIDRVWNHGFAYGGRAKLPHRKVLWLALCAATPEQLAKRGYDRMFEHHLNVGLAEYVGIADSRVAYLYDTLSEDPRHAQRLLAQAYELGLRFN